MDGSARSVAAPDMGPSPRTLRPVLDYALAALLVLWALVGLLPVGVWTGVSPRLAYERDVALQGWGVVVAALITLLLLAITRGRCAAWLRVALRRALAVRRGRFLAGLGVLASAEAVAVSVLCFARNPQLIDTWAQY